MKSNELCKMPFTMRKISTETYFDLLNLNTSIPELIINWKYMDDVRREQSWRSATNMVK